LLGPLFWVKPRSPPELNPGRLTKRRSTREPRPFPKLILKRRAASIDDYRIDDFDVEDYDPYPHIAADVAV